MELGVDFAPFLEKMLPNLPLFGIIIFLLIGYYNAQKKQWEEVCARLMQIELTLARADLSLVAEEVNELKAFKERAETEIISLKEIIRMRRVKEV